MSKRQDRQLICDIKESIRSIEIYIDRMSYKRFIRDKKTQDAVARNLEIIGEAVKAISAGLKKQYPGIPWRALAGMRDRLIHQYSGVNWEIVWEVIVDKLSELKTQIARISRQKE
jgi:uncharacterized protein with HEPN domain